ncbi:hypothetical protein BDV29DRAFT_152039 [Aspergillus leporis]|uniref:Uncharacterized protein n=1 Tax=Aspergillus leporis TaxID=41062 RepID=A0A5N5XEP1_9EURO|nr:hypothetical protein BDV29DRAFT_152039 [Aspergillus leporis]
MTKSVSHRALHLTQVTGLEGSRDNPVLLDFEDIPGSEGEEEISTFQQNFDAPKNPISIGDDATVYESPESQREGSTVVGCLHGSPVGLIRVPEENVENPKSHREYGLGTKCFQPQTEDTHTTAFGFSEPPIYYFDESRLYESPKSGWQGSTSVDLYTARSKPEKDHGIVMESAPTEPEGTARTVFGSPELPVYVPIFQAYVDVTLVWDERQDTWMQARRQLPTKYQDRMNILDKPTY